MRLEGFNPADGRLGGDIESGYYAIVKADGHIVELGWWGVSFSVPYLPLTSLEQNLYYPFETEPLYIRYLPRAEAERIAEALEAKAREVKAEEAEETARRGRERRQRICHAYGIADADYVRFCASQRLPGETPGDVIERLDRNSSRGL